MASLTSHVKDNSGVPGRLTAAVHAVQWIAANCASVQARHCIVALAGGIRVLASQALPRVLMSAHANTQISRSRTRCKRQMRPGTQIMTKNKCYKEWWAASLCAANDRVSPSALQQKYPSPPALLNSIWSSRKQAFPCFPEFQAIPKCVRSKRSFNTRVRVYMASESNVPSHKCCFCHRTSFPAQPSVPCASGRTRALQSG